MKVHNLIYFTLLMPLLCYSYPATDSNNNDSKITKLLDKSIIVEDSDHADTETAQISKRSGGGSFDFISHLKSSILGGIGKASASSSSGSSGHKSNDYGHHANSVDFDPWSLKKSVLNTLFQAVKAITGGVTAIKGQLIKGSGYVLSAGGKLVSASGDKVTDVGKAIVHSAQLSPHNDHGHGGYGHSSHPFSKFSSLSGGSSGHGSSGGGGGGGGGHGGHISVGHGSGGHASGGHGPGSHEHHPDIHTETITTYDIPPGHTHYGPPSKPPSFGSATHHYVPQGGYVASFEGPESYGYQTHEEFNKPNEISIHYHTYHTGHTGPTNPFDYGQLKASNDLTQDQAKKAADALKDIIHLLPLTTDKKITSSTGTGYGNTGESYYSLGQNSNYYNKESESTHQLGPIDTISITESLSTSYHVDPRNPSSQSHYEIRQSENTEVPSNNAHAYNTKNSENLDPSISDSHPYDVYRDMSHKYKSHSHENYVTSHQNNYQTYQTSESYKGSADIETVIAALETLPNNHKNDLQGSYSSPSLSYSMPLRSHTQQLNPTNKQNNFLNYPRTENQNNGLQIQNRHASSNTINNKVQRPPQNYKPFLHHVHDSDSQFRKRRVCI